MILKQGHTYRAMPHDGKTIWRIYRGGRCYYKYSPYSLAATQALKAAFPQYWTAIRDYGYAHPALVPFINEDPMLIVSLVEVGKTRWLVGDGKAYVDTPHYATEKTTFSVRGIMHKYQSTGSAQVLGYYSSSAPTRSIGFHLRENSSTVAVCRFDGQTTTPNPCPKDTIFTAYMDRYKVSVNGVESTFANISAFTSIAPMQIYRAGALGDGVMDLSSVVFGGDIQAHFIPMQRTDGACGMLDIVSLTFYPNANTEGAFTIAITPKA